MSKFYRSSTNKWVTGICGGIAQYLNVNVTLVRIAMVLAAFCSFGTTLLLYFIASMLTPKDPFIQYQ
ncbi:PspC domain-containing protein [Paenibacillus aestuarii]|uniref:PspC domain-containing protein n=1 Tax=Paenibacillus aestuarii TaxID=516965 RepID=A0ABW0K4F8_9BACL|nr:PspC domain-containing protein [Paenibacillus aestuarii]